DGKERGPPPHGARGPRFPRPPAPPTNAPPAAPVVRSPARPSRSENGEQMTGERASGKLTENTEAMPPHPQHASPQAGPADGCPARERCVAAGLALGRAAPEGLWGGRPRVHQLQRPDAPDRHTWSATLAVSSCGCSSMAERQVPKLIMRVRSPSPARSAPTHSGALVMLRGILMQMS